VRVAAAETITKLTIAYAPRPDGTSYGYGVMQSDLHGHALVYHGGGHKGVAAMAGFDAAEGIVCVVLTNFAEAPPVKIWAACLQTARGLPVGPLFEPAAPIVLPVETLRSFAGRYRSPEGADLEVALDDAGALVVSGGDLSGPAQPIAEDAIAFTVSGEQQTVRFLRLAGEDVSHAYMGGRLVRRVRAPAPAD
jgi:hypothetical protein